MILTRPEDAQGEATIDQEGIPVRYQDGGTGTIYGKARFNLPQDEKTMLELHKAFRTNKGVALKLLARRSPRKPKTSPQV